MTSTSLNDRHADFFDSVYQVVRLIPEGRVSTYGHIARYLGSGRSARMVGWAMNNAHNQKEYVPAHRVVNRVGMLTGKFHFSHPNEMQESLEKEQVEVIDDKVAGFAKLLWDPNVELEVF